MMLDVQGIYKKYDSVNVVEDLSFTLAAGDICGFIGPNGSGKTTTMRICATLLLPDLGDVLINGLSVLSYPREARRMIGFMPDAFPIEGNILTKDMIEFFGRSHGLFGSTLQSRMDDVIAFTNLETLLDKEFAALSKGMKQRAALATTLMHDPKLLILDEPAAGLDPRARIELRQLIRLLAEQEKTVLISSHILAELSEICNQVVVIEQGKLRGEGDIHSMQRSVHQSNALQVRCLCDAELVEAFLQQEEKVSNILIRKEEVYFDFDGDLEQQSSLIHRMCEQGLKPIRLREQEADLEEIFMSLTEGKVQ